MTVNVPSNTLDEHAPGTDTSGVYKLVAAVFLNSDLGPPGFDMIGFNEGPCDPGGGPELTDQPEPRRSR